MGFRKRLAGIKEWDFDVLLHLAASISASEANTRGSENKFVEIWETWEWLVFFQANNGSLTQEEFVKLYSLLHRVPVEFSFDYQKASEQDGLRLAGLFSDIQAILRPHLSVAFLPSSYGSDVWPLIGKPLNRVKVPSGFGSIIPEEIINSVEKRNFNASEDSNTVEMSYILSTAFVQILKTTNDLDRQARLGLRMSAFEILPWFLTFDLGKVKLI